MSAIRKIVNIVFCVLCCSIFTTSEVCGAELLTKIKNIREKHLDSLNIKSEKRDTLTNNIQKINSLVVVKDSKSFDTLKIDSLHIDSLIQDTLNKDSIKSYIRSSKYNNIQRAGLIIDSLKRSGTDLKKISVDSLARVYFTDTLYVNNGVIPTYNVNGNLYATFRMDSLLKEAIIERNIIDKEKAKLEAKLNKKRRDTLGVGTMSLISLAVPGFSQIYNRDYWKLPILYGSVGGFITGGVLMNNKYKETVRLYNEALSNGASTDRLNSINVDYYNYKNARAMMYVGAAVSYLYFVCDGIWSYDYEVRDTKKATLLAVFLPGAGQIYNKAYWKLPILYGGYAALGYVISFNGKGYNRFKKAYDLMMDGDDTTNPDFGSSYPPELIRNTRNNYRRYRDMAIFYTVGLYLVSIVDAYVDASLSHYDISDDLSLKVEPMMDLRNTQMASQGGYSPSTGLSVKLTF